MRPGLVTAVVLICLGAPASVHAQVVERPVPFDSAGRVNSITPPLASRLELRPPVWPVTGDFRQVRLYQSGDAYVLVVERTDGSLERYPLAPEAREALRSAVSTGMSHARNPMGEEGNEVISRSAKSAFMRNQMIASAFIYAPSLAALTNDPSTGTAVYLLATGGAFFAAARLARDLSVSRAQNHLATDGAIRGAIMTSALYYGLTGSRDADPYEAAVLVGSLGGSVAGFHAGKGLTDGEAQGLTMGSNIAALTTMGLMGSAGMFREKCRTVETSFGTRTDCDGGLERPDYLILVGAGAAGYPLGLRYVRRAAYTVTAGDLNTLYTAGTLGVMAALTAIIESDVSEEAAWAAVTVGFLGGIVAGDRLLIKPADHTKGEAWLLGLGAVAGGLIGAVLPVLAETENGTFVLGMVTAGAILGTFATERMINPRPGAARVGALRHDSGGERRVRSPFSFSAAGTALSAAGVPGRHTLLHVSF